MKLMQPINRLKQPISCYGVTDLLSAQGGEKLIIMQLSLQKV